MQLQSVELQSGAIGCQSQFGDVSGHWRFRIDSLDELDGGSEVRA